jgi:SAM-dependent methyltransferase
MYEHEHLAFLDERLPGMDAHIQAQITAFLPAEHVGSLLDCGAGNSQYPYYISCDRNVTADVSQNLAGNIDHLLVPDERLAVEAASFDVVLLLDVLKHVHDQDFVFGEIKRVLTPIGRLFISVPFVYREHETPSNFARYTMFRVRELITRQQGKIVRLSKVGNVYYTLLSLFLKSGNANGELNRLGVPGTVVNRHLRSLVPVLAPMLCKAPHPDDGIYHHLLLEMSFT